MMLAKLPNKTAKACTKSLKTWTTFFGIPVLMRSDGGPSFDCKLFSKFCEELGVVHVLTRAYKHPALGSARGWCKRSGR